MNYNLVTSKEIIGRIFTTYNIKSAGFIGKVPQWIGEALNKLKLTVQLQPVVTKVEVSNYRAAIPRSVRRLDAVIYNNSLLPRVSGKRLEYPSENLFSPTYVAGTTQEIEYDEAGNIVSINTSADSEVSISELDQSNNHNYILNGSGFIDTSFESGIITLYYLKIGEELDAATGAYFPLIPDLEFCKDALVWYVLMNILYSGYNHPILSLASSNPYLNPAVQWESLIPKARNESLRLDREQRELHMRLWTTVVLDADAYSHSFKSKYE